MSQPGKRLFLLGQAGFRVKLLSLLGMFFRLIEPNVINQEFYRIPLPVFRSFLAPGAAHGGIENEIERRTGTDSPPHWHNWWY